MSRFACLFVPLFPLAARLRSEPDLKGEAVAILQGNGNAACVVAATRRARKAGVRPGMSLAQTRALMPKMTARPRDAICEYSAQQSLLEVAAGFSPRIESAEGSITYLEVSGLERHFAGDSPEEELGHALILAAEKAGLPIRVGIASSKLAARVAAEQPDSPTSIAEGDEASFLAPLPLIRLAPELDAAQTLELWGIRSIGDFARLPKNEVTSRLGEAGRILHEKARGMDRHPLVPFQPPPTFAEGMEMEWPLVALEPFLFVVRPALERLCRRLRSRGMGCNRLEIFLHLDPAGHHERSVQLPAPTCDSKTLLTLLRLDLERQPPGAPVTGFHLVAHPDHPRGAQLSLFGPPALPPDRLATTLARLFALLGPGRLGSPHTTDSHRPEGLSLIDFDPPSPPKENPEPVEGKGLLAVRVLRPPAPLEVLLGGSPGNGSATAEETAGCYPSPPREVRSLIRESGTKQLRIEGSVRVASGPWSMEEAWWSDDPATRDYWDVELSDGGLYRIFRDRGCDEWFADGIYD